MESATVFNIIQQSIVSKCNKSNYCLTSATNSQIVVCADCLFNLHALRVEKSIVTTHTWKGHTAKINEISFMEATGELANVFTTAGSDGKVIFWDARMADAVKIVEINRPCYCTASNANICLVGCDRDAFIIDIRKMKPVKQYKSLHSEDITSVGFCLDPQLFHTCSMDGIINIVDTNAIKQSDSAPQSIRSDQPLLKAAYLYEKKEIKGIYAVTSVESVEVYDSFNEENLLIHQFSVRDDNCCNIVESTVIGGNTYIVHTNALLNGGIMQVTGKGSIAVGVLKSSALLRSIKYIGNDCWIGFTEHGTAEVYQKSLQSQMIIPDLGVAEEAKPMKEGKKGAYSNPY